jgi:hypothetical protein
MSADEARIWFGNWQKVNERQEQERANQTYEQRLAALATLMASADLFSPSQAEAEDAVVRERWIRLKSLNGRR